MFKREYRRAFASTFAAFVVKCFSASVGIAAFFFYRYDNYMDGFVNLNFVSAHRESNATISL